MFVKTLTLRWCDTLLSRTVHQLWIQSLQHKIIFYIYYKVNSVILYMKDIFRQRNNILRKSQYFLLLSCLCIIFNNMNFLWYFSFIIKLLSLLTVTLWPKCNDLLNHKITMYSLFCHHMTFLQILQLFLVNLRLNSGYFMALFSAGCCRVNVRTFVTQDASPADVTLARPVALQPVITAAIFTATVCSANTAWDRKQQINRHLLLLYIVELYEPWSQWTPYFPLWQVSQAVPLKPLLHWQIPVPLVPSEHAPLPKQDRPFGPGHGSQCSPKNPPQHLRTWKQQI